MFAVNYSTLRENMKSLFDQISNDMDTMIVTRKEENMVVMSQSSYDSLMETIYLLENTNNRDHLMKSIDEYRKGKIKEHGILEVGDENNLD